MKILFVNTNIGYGGASKMMVFVANTCAKYGHDVTFLTYRSSDYYLKIDSKVSTVHLQLEDESGNGKGLLNTVKTLRGYIKTHKIDLVVGFLIPSQIRISLACCGLNCKTLFSQRGDPYQSTNGLKNNILNYIYGRMFCTADMFVFQTPMAAKFYSSKVQRRSVVIANPIKPLLRTKNRTDGIEKEIVCVARLDVKQKRQDLLIDAFCRISAKYPDYMLKLYGDGFEYDEKILKEKAKSNPNICFMGATKDVVAAIQNATAFVLSSDFEGIPNALLEAMSVGVPCISTDCSPGGAAMLIENKKNGILVSRNDAKALAEAMEYIILHPEEAEQMGKNGMEVTNIYSEDVISKKWIDFIEECIK